MLAIVLAPIGDQDQPPVGDALQCEKTPVHGVPPALPLDPRRAQLFAGLLTAGALLPGSAYGSEDVSTDLSVSTTGGTLLGVATGGSRQWRGIPYAASPVDELRWRPPQPVSPWQGVRDASEFAAPCAQPGPDGSLLGSEDCLYLNVFAPNEAADRLPVMVHLHPGGNTFGWAYQDATPFTDRGVMVVTLGYRLGAFGFMGHPAFSAEGAGVSGEYALLDQIAALTWVRDNIASFGGDPGTSPCSAVPPAHSTQSR